MNKNDLKIGNKVYTITFDNFININEITVKNIKDNFINVCECENCLNNIGTKNEFYMFDNAININELFLTKKSAKSYLYNIIKNL